MIDVRTYFLAVLTALAIGFAGGYYTHGRFDKAKQTDALTRERQQSASGIVASQNKSLAIEGKVQQGNTAADAAKSAALDRVTKQLERTHDVLQYQIAPQLDAAGKTALAAACDNPHLDVGTVRLLNAARTGAAVDPAIGRDGAGPAAADAAAR